MSLMAAATAVTTSYPWWGIPAITAGGAFAGASVGGFATYLTARSTRVSAAQRDDEITRKAEIRSIAVRFTVELRNAYVACLDIQKNVIEVVGKFTAMAQEAKDRQDRGEQTDPERFQALAIEMGINQPEDIFSKALLLEDAMSKMGPVSLVLNEFRIVAPIDLLEKAIACKDSLFNLFQYTEEERQNMQFLEIFSSRAKEHDKLLLDFSNAVRRYLDLDEFVPEPDDSRYDINLPPSVGESRR